MPAATHIFKNVLWGVLVSLSCSTRSAECNAHTATTYAEKLVIREVSAGRIAKFGNLPVEERTVPADFLARLLTGRLKGIFISHEGVLIEHAVFRGKLGVAGAEIPYTTWLNDCDFEDDVDLSRSHLHSDLSMVNSRFHGDADFDGLRADGNIAFRNARFYRLFDISSSQINGTLDVLGASFLDQAGRPAQFDSTRVAIQADLRNVAPSVPLILDGVESQILWLTGNSGNATSQKDLQFAKRINLSHAVVHREFSLQAMQIEVLVASSLKIEGLADFENLKITSQADLSHSQLFDLVLTDDIQWPREESLELAGISFQYINPQSRGRTALSAGRSGDAEWKNLVDWVDGSNYTSAPYQQLEDALKREGRIELADNVFENRETRARSRGGLGWEAKIKNFLLFLLVGYGREPQRAFYWSAIVVLFGWLVVFRRREDVDPRDEKDRDKPYDPFWYSLDLFLPIATLEAADIWIPRQSSWIRRYYAGIHAVLGWILIPIGLAAITGLVK